MKTRDYRNLSEGSIYHIYNRGNNKENIFFDEQDYKAFLFRIALAIGVDKDRISNSPLLENTKSRIRISPSPKNTFKIHAFCLMPNHFHFLIEQNSEEKIFKLLHRVCTSYSMYINKKYGRVGHLFQDRFKSVRVGTNEQLMLVSSYIHINPVKDNLVSNSEEYKWSSYNDFVNNRSMPITNTDFILEVFGSVKNLKKQTNDYLLSRTRLDI